MKISGKRGGTWLGGWRVGGLYSQLTAILAMQMALSDFLVSQMTFFARGLEIFSEAHKQLGHISPEIDLKVTLRFFCTRSCDMPAKAGFGAHHACYIFLFHPLFYRLQDLMQLRNPAGSEARALLISEAGAPKFRLH